MAWLDDLQSWFRKSRLSPESPACPVARPAGVSRRHFLQALGITATTIYLGGHNSPIWVAPEGVVYPKPERLEFWAYAEMGGTIGNQKALAQVNFDIAVPTEILSEDCLQELADLLDVIEAGKGDSHVPTATEQKAADALDEFTRMKMRQDGFYRRILPPLSITNEDLERQVPLPGCIPFQALPPNLYSRRPVYLGPRNQPLVSKYRRNQNKLLAIKGN